MKKSLVILGLIISGSALGQTLKDAIRLTVNEQYDEATQIFVQLIQKEPVNATNYYYFGDNYIQQENIDSARIIFQKGTDLDAKNPLPLVGLGAVLLYEAKVAEANTKVEKTLQVYNSLKSAYENNTAKTEQARIEVEKALVSLETARTEAEKEKVKVQQAEAYFEKALTIAGTKNASAFVALAKALMASPNKNLPKAMEYVERAVQLEPRSVEAYIAKGDVYTERNEGTAAAENYNKALDIDKISLKALLRKAILYRRTTSYDIAIGVLEEATKIDPSFAPAYRELAENYFAKRTKEALTKAIDYYNRYLTLSKNNFSARLRYAQFLFIAKEYQKALAEVTQLTQLRPDNIYAQRIKAYSSLETGDYKTTKATLDILFQKLDKSKIVQKDLEYYGKSLAKTEQDSLAIIYYRQAFDMDTSRVDLLKEIGDTYYKLKKYKEAAAVYKEKIDTKINVAAADYFKLGQAYFFDEQLLNADTALSKVNEMSPKWASGFLWRAQINTHIDSLTTLWLAKPHYEKYIEVVLADTANISKYKKQLVEAYQYFANYHTKKDEFNRTKEYLKKILELDPENVEAKKALEIIRKMEEEKKSPQK
jgi:tetratricopeptide (TPR) repeat protein